METVRAS